MGRLLLVRHGQASFGADDYDVLSETGWEQARLLGRRLAEQGVRPDMVVHGGLARQRDTADAAAQAAGWEAPVSLDPRWAEFDHLSVIGAHGGPDLAGLDRRAFQRAYEQATGRWTAGEAPLAPVETLEPFVDFTARVGAALDDAGAQAGPGATVVVVTSGGPVAVAAALLTGLGPHPAALGAAWDRLNTVLVNAGLTTVVVGATGPRLLSYNDHAHVAGELLTYR